METEDNTCSLDSNAVVVQYQCQHAFDKAFEQEDDALLVTAVAPLKRMCFGLLCVRSVWKDKFQQS